MVLFFEAYLDSVFLCVWIVFSCVLPLALLYSSNVPVTPGVMYPPLVAQAPPRMPSKTQKRTHPTGGAKTNTISKKAKGTPPSDGGLVRLPSPGTGDRAEVSSDDTPTNLGAMYLVSQGLHAYCSMYAEGTKNTPRKKSRGSKPSTTEPQEVPTIEEYIEQISPAEKDAFKQHFTMWLQAEKVQHDLPLCLSPCALMACNVMITMWCRSLLPRGHTSPPCPANPESFAESRPRAARTCKAASRPTGTSTIPSTRYTTHSHDVVLCIH
jgi:hypothetical protein